MKAVFGNSFYDFENLISKQVEVVGVLPEKFEEVISIAKKVAKNKKNLELVLLSHAQVVLCQVLLLQMLVHQKFLT